MVWTCFFTQSIWILVIFYFMTTCHLIFLWFFNVLYKINFISPGKGFSVIYFFYKLGTFFWTFLQLAQNQSPFGTFFILIHCVWNHSIGQVEQSQAIIKPNDGWRQMHQISLAAAGADMVCRRLLMVIALIRRLLRVFLRRLIGATWVTSVLFIDIPKTFNAVVKPRVTDE